MDRIDALDLITANGKAKLNELQAGLVEAVRKAGNSFRFKSASTTPDGVNAGSYEFKRFANATSKQYGTARAAGKGDAVKAPAVTVKLDKNKEIVEELEKFDADRFGLETGVISLATKRQANHRAVVSTDIEKAFWQEAYLGALSNSAEVGTGIVGKIIAGIGASELPEDALERAIQALEATENIYVEKVDRSLMGAVVQPKLYGKLKNKLNTLYNTGFMVSDENILGLNGVGVFSEVYLPKKVEAIVQVIGTVAQPVVIDEYDVERIQLSKAFAVELFYDYGTKNLAPDLNVIMIELDSTHTSVTTVGSALPANASVVDTTIYVTTANSASYDPADPISATNYPAGTMFTGVKGDTTTTWTQYNA